MRKIVWGASLAFVLTAGSAYANCSDEISHLQAQGPLTPRAQEMLGKAKSADQRNKESDCMSWIENANKEMIANGRSARAERYNRDDQRYSRDDRRYDDRESSRYDDRDRYDRRTTEGSGSSSNPIGNLLNSLGR